MPKHPKNNKSQAAASSEPRHMSAALKMACGTCCLPACHVLRRAQETGENSSSGEFVTMACTWSECAMGGQMHKECYDRLEKVRRPVSGTHTRELVPRP